MDEANAAHSVAPLAERSDSLLCRVRGRVCALPLAHVVEIMRPLPIEILGGAPAFVCGASVVRGRPIPVVDPGVLLGTTDPPAPTRFVTVRAGGRHVALAVESVLGVRALTTDTMGDVPSLLRDAQADVVAAMGTLDAQLLLVLQTARLVPESVWRTLERGEAG